MKLFLNLILLIFFMSSCTTTKKITTESFLETATNKKCFAYECETFEVLTDTFHTRTVNFKRDTIIVLDHYNRPTPFKFYMTGKNEPTEEMLIKWIEPYIDGAIILGAYNIKSTGKCKTFPFEGLPEDKKKSE